jgi:tetratricopeptide (TPR) repeat protein
LVSNLKLLFRLWFRPADAIGAILDEANLLFTSLLVIAVTFGLQAGVGSYFHFSFYTPLLVLAVVYVPGILLIAILLAHLGSFGTVFERDYSALLSCAGIAWSATQLPLLLAAWTAPRQVFVILAGLAYLYFAVLMFLAVRAVFSLENTMAGLIVALSWIPLVGAALAWGTLSHILGFLASPFFLFYAFYYLRGEFGNLGQGLRSRQSLHRMLQAAAVNPHDGEAQYQIGLIHQQRHQYAEAIRRFQAAVAIDPTETDAHFQLGRIAREQGRAADALTHLTVVLKQDDKHSMNEIHRELGATYLALGRLDEARRELYVYTERREYDPEGLYYYGEVLEALGQSQLARDAYLRAVEAARTAPRYRRRFTARWSRLSQKHARKIEA